MKIRKVNINPSVEALEFKDLKGNVAHIYLEDGLIKYDSDMRAIGSGTAWRDMIGDLFGRRLNSGAGKVDYDWANNAIKFQKNGDIDDVKDRVQANLEINHDLKVGTEITFKPHIHWFQRVALTEVSEEHVTTPASGESVLLDYEVPTTATVVVTNAAGTTTYVEDTDYSINYGYRHLTNLAGGALTPDATLSVSYAYLDDALEDVDYTIKLRYRLIRNGYGINIGETNWQEMSCSVNNDESIFDWDQEKMSGYEYIGQITQLDDITVDCGVSDTLQFQMAREDSEDGNLLVYFMDLHGQVDSNGSDEEYVKA